MKLIILTTIVIVSTTSIVSQSAVQRTELKLTTKPLNNKTHIIQLKTISPIDRPEIISKEKALLKPKKNKVKKQR